MSITSKLLVASAILAFCAPTVSVAQFDRPPYGESGRSDNPDRRDQSRRHGDQVDRARENRIPDLRNNGARVANPRWARGDHLPDQFRQNRYFVDDWQQRRLKPPPRGYRWVRNDNYDYYLVAIATGLIADTVYRDAYGDLWQQRYAREYSYGDDLYYQQCRTNPDPAGVIAGAIIGGLLGNAVGRGPGETGATVAGVIVGGALGAALTGKLDCEDRSYAYKTYYDAFNEGRPHAVHQWRNPRNGHYGDFRVDDYFYDPAGFRCANYTQQIFIDGRPQAATGHACQQPDGTWTVVG
jgi:Ni/Co efflux regulator RcnB/surface antigen